MFSDKYKKDNEKINLDDSFKEELAKNMRKGDFKVKKNNGSLKAIVGVAAAMAVIVGGYFLTQDTVKIEYGGDLVSNEESRQDEKPAGGDIGTQGVIGETSMMSFLRYDGKDYRYVRHNIDSKNINNIKGEKLGVTIKGEIDEEFSSYAKDVEIYTVKGYEDKSVLLGILETEEDMLIDVYSYCDDSEIKTGEDLISKMKIEGNIKKVNIGNGMGVFTELKNHEEINTLVNELKDSKNMLDDEEFMDTFYSKYAGQSKGISIELNDGIVREFDLYQTGYLFIDGYIFDIKDKEKALEIYNAI
ncbi:MAG: hypothetical protein ACRC6T_14580 [Sarcina sp.]